MDVAVETAEHPSERTRCGGRQAQFLSELVELRRIPKVRGQVRDRRIEIRESRAVRRGKQERHAYRAGQSGSIAAHEDVANELAADGGQLDRAEVVTCGQVHEQRLVTELLGPLQIDRAPAEVRA